MDIVNLPSLLAIPNSFGAPPSSLQVGEIVDAVVLQILESGLARLSVADGVIDVRTAVPLVPGAKVRLAVTGTSAGIQLTVLTDANASGRTVAIPAALVGRGQPVPDPASAPRALAPGPLDAGAGAAASTKAQAPIVEISVPGGSSPPPSPVSPDQPVRSPAAAAALGEAVRAAATRQGGLAPLFADLAQTASPGASAQVSSIAAAAARVLALRLPLHGTLTAADVKQAVTRSGLFLEAHLAEALPTSSQAEAPAATAEARAAPGHASSSVREASSNATPSNAVAQDVPDLKAALLVFRQVVKLWLDGEIPTASAARTSPTAVPPGNLRPTEPPGTSELPTAPTSANSAGVAPSDAPPASKAAPPPPYRGAPPTAQAAASPSLPSDAPPRVAAERLLAGTDAALARHTLLQVASLPDQPGPAGARDVQQGTHWAFEVPFATAQGGTAIAQFEISRDARAATAETRTIWRARFSLDVEPMGPVHAMVAVLGDQAAVTLWAERETSAARLREGTGLLTDALRNAELEPGDIQFRTGTPAAPRPAAGRFLDRAS